MISERSRGSAAWTEKASRIGSLDLVDEPRQARHPADCRDRGPPVRDADLGKPPCARQHLLVVEERFAHPHVDEVVDGLESTEVEHLVQDLGGAQVATEPHRAGGAERARERAARLRRDADRTAPVAVAHQHGFDRMPVLGAEERLDRAVGGVRLVLERERRERHGLGELGSECPRQVRHLRVAGRAASRPRPHLTGAERGLATLGQRLLEQGQVHAAKVACRS